MYSSWTETEWAYYTAKKISIINELLLLLTATVLLWVGLLCILLMCFFTLISLNYSRHDRVIECFFYVIQYPNWTGQVVYTSGVKNKIYTAMHKSLFKKTLLSHSKLSCLDCCFSFICRLYLSFEGEVTFSRSN